MHRTLVSLSFLFVAPVGLIALPVAADELPRGITADNESFHGLLRGADKALTLRFQNGEKPREVPAADLAYWGALAEPAAGAQLVLAGGGVVVADGVRIEKELVRGKSASLGAVELPMEVLAGIVLRPPADRAALERLVARLVAVDSQSDRLLLDNGDELSGTILGVDDKSVQLETEGGKSAVDVDKVRALAFNAMLIQQPRLTGLRMLVGLRDGSRVTTVSLDIDGPQARLKLPGSAELATPLEAIVALQTLGGRSHYISDLTPTSYKHLPYLNLSWPFHADRSVTGAPLRAGGHQFAKGLGMHSPARITYDLPPGVRRFDAEVAIDAEAGRRGSVVFRVFVDDGGGGWQERVTSPVVRGGEPPLAISADLSGAKRISLLVDYAERGDELDHADWLNARVSQ